MKVTVSKQLIGTATAIVFCISFFSCKKIVDIQPKTSLTNTQVYRNVFDADAAVIGIYGKLMGLAKQYVILNELRADLMDVTTNADLYLKEISTHNVSANNPYADPRPFFSLINDCNDVLKHFNIMLQENKMKKDEYNMRYSDIGALRSWLYLQLGIHFGKVPYVTDALENIDAARDQSKYPLIPFNQLLDSLINFTAALPYKLPYPAGTSLNISVDASNTARFFIEKNAFLGDLYLWKGNYNKAASYYRDVMDLAGYNITPGSAQWFDYLKVRFAEVTANNDLAVGYIRFREMDERAIVDNNSQGWRSMFARGQDDIWRWEWLWILPFNSNFAPENPFVDIFSNSGGRYLVRPSQPAMDNWNSQTQSNGFPYDARGRMTWKTLGGQPVITKYLYNYLSDGSFLPVNPLQKNGQWFLNRAAVVHLHFAEAANRDGRHRIAYAFINNGISGAYPAPSGATDVTNYQNTLWESYPYSFDGRMGDAPRYRGDWHRHTGIRNRARLVPYTIPASADSTLAVEDEVMNESALELAYEGHRWPDLLRIALRRNDPSIIAKKVGDKLRKDGFAAEATKAEGKLSSIDGLYLPFKW
jgi:hypothetical protein